jgi:glucose 1-dehydrogenase
MRNDTQIAVVTGAAAGIGAAIRDRLLGDGWSVIGIDIADPIDREDLITRNYRHVIGDVADPAAHARAAEFAGADLRAWINNAGVIEDAALHVIDEPTIDRTLDVNLRGTINGTRQALARFVADGVPGSIVNVSSIHGRGAFPGSPVYDATKGAIEALTRYAAVEYGGRGIRTNCVAPGAIRTELLQRVIAGSPDPVVAEHEFAALHPINRLAEPAEVAAVVAFLLGDDASFVNGAVVPVDGGASARFYAYPPHAAAGSS